MTTAGAADGWVQSQASHVRLGDRRNGVRLQSMLHSLLEDRSVSLAAVFKSNADLQGAYDFVENDAIRVRTLVDGFAHATAASAAQESKLFVAIDASSLSLPDPEGTRGMGSLGARQYKARGLKFFEALALNAQGVPLGLLGLELWTRSLTQAKRPADQRALQDKESRYWLTLRSQARERLRAASDTVSYCFLLDADADNWAVLLDMVQANDGREHTIVRACQHRRAVDAHVDTIAAPYEYLQDLLSARPVAGHFELSLSATPKRTARHAKIEVRFSPVTLDLRCSPSARHALAPLWAVHAREAGPLPEGEERVEWYLLTTLPVETLEQAIEVCHSYSHRWRCEDFHKCIKGGDVDFEQTQLRSAPAIERWFVLHAVVAMRVLTLTYRMRQTPQAPATTVLRAIEIEALKRFREKRRLRNPSQWTVATVFPLLAEMGGYTGGRHRQPGPKVLGRALRYLEVLAEGLALAQNQNSAKNQGQN